MSVTKMFDSYIFAMETAINDACRRRLFKSFVIDWALLDRVDKNELDEENRRRLQIRYRYAEEQRPEIMYYPELEKKTFKEVTTLKVMATRVITDPEYLNKKFPFFASLHPQYKSLRNFLHENGATFDKFRDMRWLSCRFNSLRVFRDRPLRSGKQRHTALRHAGGMAKLIIKQLSCHIDVDYDYDYFRENTVNELFEMLKLFPCSSDDEIIQHFLCIDGGMCYLVYLLMCILMALYPVSQKETLNIKDFDRKIFMLDEIDYQSDGGTIYDHRGNEIHRPQEMFAELLTAAGPMFDPYLATIRWNTHEQF